MCFSPVITRSAVCRSQLKSRESRIYHRVAQLRNLSTRDSWLSERPNWTSLSDEQPPISLSLINCKFGLWRFFMDSKVLISFVENFISYSICTVRRLFRATPKIKSSLPTSKSERKLTSYDNDSDTGVRHRSKFYIN